MIIVFLKYYRKFLFRCLKKILKILSINDFFYVCFLENEIVWENDLKI